MGNVLTFTANNEGIKMAGTRPQVFSTTLHTRINPALLNEIDRIQEKYSNPVQGISKADLIREALARGLVLIEEELKGKTGRH